MRTKTSQAGNFDNEQGFTLLELLVVLAIVGLMATLMPGFLLRDNNALDLDHAAKAVVGGLRKVQNAAVFENSDQLFTIDVARRQFLPGEGAIPVQLRGDIELFFITARQEQTSQSSGQIRFYSDGSSTGGRIALTLENHQQIIDIDWLTGQISISDQMR